MNRRGASLATTLVFVTLALMIGLALASTSVSHLHFSSSQSSRNKARAAADSVLQMAVAHVLENPEFGQARESDENFELEFAGSVGKISFNRSQASDWGIPYSTNNRQTEEPTEGALGRQVPPEGVHLIAIGQYGNTTKRLEAVLHIPDFPYALASAGPISSSGSLFIGGLEDLSDAFPEINEDELEPADLASNALGTAINLDGEARIHGNIQAVGSITLGEEVDVEGEIRPSSDPITVAELDLSDIRPRQSLPVSHRAGLELSGSHHINGGGAPTTLTNGLTLDDGILYVDGDLEIRGGIKGRGAILVDGSLLIRGGAALAADNQVAVVAKGDVTIEQSSGRSSYFQGMVYTEGDFTASDTTLLGSFVANRPGDAVNPGSRLSLHDANVVHIPEFSSFETEARNVVFTLNEPPSDNPKFQDKYEIHVNASPEEWEDFLTWVNETDLGSDDDHSQRATTIYEKLESLDIQVVQTGDNFGYVYGSGPENSPLLELSQDFQRAFAAGGNPLVGFQGDQQIIYEEQLPAFQFDLNEFIDEVDRARVILWREF